MGWAGFVDMKCLIVCCSPLQVHLKLAIKLKQEMSRTYYCTYLLLWVEEMLFELAEGLDRFQSDIECSFMGALVWVRKFMWAMLTYPLFHMKTLVSITEWSQMKLSRSEPSALHPHQNVSVHGANLKLVRGKTLRICIACMLYSVGVGFSASTVARYRSAVSVPLYPNIDVAYTSILGKSIVLFP